MFGYIFITLFVAVLAIFGYKSKKVGLFITFFLLFLSMFRGENVGHDTKGYLEWNNVYLRVVGAIDLSEDDASDMIGRSTELLSNALYSIVYNAKLPPRTILYVYSLITILGLYYSFKRFRINVALGMMFYVLLGLYFFSLTAARQMAAVSVFLYGLSFLFSDGKQKFLFIRYKKPYNFFLFTFIAGMIHMSAVFFIWVYIVRFIKFDKTLGILVSAAICLVFSLLTINTMGMVYGIFGMDYVTSYKGLYDSVDKHPLKIVADCLVLIYYFWWIVNKKGSTRLDINDSLYLLAIIFLSMFSSYSILMSRISFYLQVFLCIYLSKRLEETSFKKDNSTLLITFCYIILRAYFAKDWFDMLESEYYLMF